MQSLRTRRSQAPRQAQRTPTTSNRLAKNNASNRDTRKSKVDDRIKKRMSMRYADISGPTELSIPDVPSLPVGIAASANRRRPGEQEELVADRSVGADESRRADDLEHMLDDDNFDPDAYLKAKLANSTEAELKSLQSSLRGAKDGVAFDLQRNVFKNYAEFVLISKEISTLENELLELKESLSEYKSMPSLLHIPDPSSSSSTISTFRRSSMADLRIMYFNQMQALHAQIEGSSKFAPTLPGRHVIAETDGVLSLNAATYKPIGKVKFVVLDDLVLVARRRRRNGGGGGGGSGNPSSGSEGKLVAERCWPINEMLVLDTKDSPSMTNVFKIRHGKETHVYRTQSSGDKKSLLAQFRQVAEELAAKRRKEREGEHERRKTMMLGGNLMDKAPPMPDWMAELSEKAGEGSSMARDKAERDNRWVSEWSDDLSVSIALKEWDKAVGLVEEGKAKSSVTPALATKLPVLTGLLTTSLLSSLALPSNRKAAVVHLISLLIRLDAGPAARRTFLEMREQVMKTLIRKIAFSGDTASYVGEMCMVWFTAIKHTADWFLASFKENEVASSFVEWSRKQIEAYAEMFRTQVYGSDVDTEVIDECVKLTYTQSKKLLQEYGLDFRFLLDELLPKEASTAVSPEARMSKPFSFRGHSIQVPKHDVDSSVLSAFLSPGSSSAASNSTLGTPSRIPSIPLRRRGSPAPPLPVAPASASVIPSSYGTSSNRTSDISSTIYPASATIPTSSSRPPTPTRSRTPNPPSSLTAADPPPVPIIAPTPRSTRTPPPGGRQGMPDYATPRERPPRALRGSPAPPPRSSNRPGSSAMHRPAPVAIPPREGMF
ncbi:exocyst complex component exo84 [Pleurotus ostreatus]|nr:exocyst complex component exo84 [Pleurotus ostreatus]